MAVKDPVDGHGLMETWNRTFRALSAEPRRQIVISLAESPTERALGLPEAANPPFKLQDPENLRVELVHEHLPLLAEGGYVEWSMEPFEVQRGESFEDVAVVLESLLAEVDELPEHMVEGCQRLEEARGDFAR